MAPDEDPTLHDPELILSAEPCDKAGSSATDVVEGEVLLGTYDELNTECIPYLTIHILDLTDEYTKATKNNHDEAGDTAIETNSGGATMSGKRHESYNTCAVSYG